MALDMSDARLKLLYATHTALQASRSPRILHSGRKPTASSCICFIVAHTLHDSPWQPDRSNYIQLMNFRIVVGYGRLRGKNSWFWHLAVTVFGVSLVFFCSAKVFPSQWNGTACECGCGSCEELMHSCPLGPRGATFGHDRGKGVLLVCRCLAQVCSSRDKVAVLCGGCCVVAWARGS